MYAWGLNNYYQLGTGDMENKYFPAHVSSLAADKDWKCVAAGQHHTVAVNKYGKNWELDDFCYFNFFIKQECNSIFIIDICKYVHT